MDRLSKFRRSVLMARGQPFDPAMRLTGGEDSALLHDLAASGATLVHEPAALGFELVPLSRLNRDSLRWLRFRHGQLRTAKVGGPARRVLWQAIGAARVVPFGGGSGHVLRPAAGSGQEGRGPRAG